MGITYTAAEAALLDAQQALVGLLARYEHALEALLDEGPARDGLAQRVQTLQAHREILLAQIERMELLPRDADSELADLTQLSDRVRGWLDQAATTRLCGEFAQAERELAEALQQASDEGLAGLDELAESARESASQLASVAEST